MDRQTQIICKERANSSYSILFWGDQPLSESYDANGNGFYQELFLSEMAIPGIMDQSHKVLDRWGDFAEEFGKFLHDERFLPECTLALDRAKAASNVLTDLFANSLQDEFSMGVRETFLQWLSSNAEDSGKHFLNISTDGLDIPWHLLSSVVRENGGSSYFRRPLGTLRPIRYKVKSYPASAGREPVPESKAAIQKYVFAIGETSGTKIPKYSAIDIAAQLRGIAKAAAGDGIQTIPIFSGPTLLNVLRGSEADADIIIVTSHGLAEGAGSRSNSFEMRVGEVISAKLISTISDDIVTAGKSFDKGLPILLVVCGSGGTIDGTWYADALPRSLLELGAGCVVAPMSGISLRASLDMLEQTLKESSSEGTKVSDVHSTFVASGTDEAFAKLHANLFTPFVSTKMPFSKGPLTERLDQLSLVRP